MTKHQLTTKKASLEKELAKVTAELDNLVSWPRVGGEYWFIDPCGEAINCTWTNHTIDRYRHVFLGVYRSKEAALAAAEKIREFVREMNKGK